MQEGVFSSAATATVLLLLLLQFPQALSQDSECLHHWLQEPPLFEDIDCNPWESTSALRLQCQASVPPSATAEIHWFFEEGRITSSSPQLREINDASDSSDSSILVLTSIATFENGRSGLEAGNYHCQLLVNSNYTSIPTRAFVLIHETDDPNIIVRQPCRDDTPFFESNNPNRCAGDANMPVSFEPSTPTQPPTTSPPSNSATSRETSNSTTSPDSTTTLPSTSSSTDSTSNATGDISPTSTTLGGSEAGSQNGAVWVYVLVAVAAVFGMIIVVLTILCVGLCLKKNKTEDTYKQKGADIKQFTSNSMVSNGLYQRKDDGGITSGTHNTAHSQISDYNTLGERDYEVIDVGDDKHDYHHLQRPSPPMLPSGRNATFNFTPPKEFQSMSTLTSQLGGKFDGRGEVLQQSPSPNGVYPTKSASEGPEDHVYHGLEPNAGGAAFSSTSRPFKDIYRSPTSSDANETIPRGTMPTMDMAAGGFGYNESLYSPNFESSGRTIGVQQGGLENVPETGSMFCEPRNPTAFPVHNYEKIPTTEYETPVVTRKKNSATAPPTTTMASSVPSPSLTNSNTGPRSRSNTGPRYETEMPGQQSAMEEPQYSKLMRPSIDESCSANNTQSQEYSELSLTTDDETMLVRTHLDVGLFPNSTSKPRGAGKRAKADKTDKSFTIPSHIDVSGGVVNREVTSPTDSLQAYIAKLQESGEASDSQIEELMFTPQEMNTINIAEAVQAMQQASTRRNGSLEGYDVAHGGNRRNGSLDTGSGRSNLPPTSSSRGPPKRAWSEERGSGGNGFPPSHVMMAEREGGMMQNRCGGFSSSAMGGFLTNGQSRKHSEPSHMISTALHRDLRPNGLDPRLPEFARSRTMV